MSQELIYTYAAGGLRAGSSGLCTVAATAGLSQKLEDKLVALSGYRLPCSPDDPHAPVVWGHYKLMISGRLCHVLSRVGAARLDDGQQSAKLAHHLVLTPDELPLGGPAWLLSQPGLLERHWNGDPRHLPIRHMPAGESPAGVCKRWQELTGDAGWGGVLAGTAIEGQQAMIIYERGMQPLPLMAEALALLPLEQRWDVTFSTYAVELPPGVGCRWRGVLAGSREADAAKRGSPTLVIDLTRPLGQSRDSAYVRAARCGVTIRGPAPAKVETHAETELPIVATKPSISLSPWPTPAPVTPNRRRILVATATCLLIAVAVVLARQGHLALARRPCAEVPLVKQIEPTESRPLEEPAAASESSQPAAAAAVPAEEKRPAVVTVPPKPAWPKVYLPTLPAAVASLASDCELALAGVESACEGRTFRLRIERAAEAGEWPVVASDDGGRDRPVGSFRLAEGELRFHNGAADPLLTLALGNCVLQVKSPSRGEMAFALRQPVAGGPLVIDPAVSNTEAAVLLPEGTEGVQIRIMSIVAPGKRNAPGTWDVVGEPASPRLELTADARGESRPIRFGVSLVANDLAIVLQCAYAGFDTKDLEWEPMEKLLAQQKVLKPDDVATALKISELRLGKLTRPIPGLATDEQVREFEQREEQLKAHWRRWRQVSNALKTASAGWIVHYDLFATVDKHRVLVAASDLDEARSRIRPAK